MSDTCGGRPIRTQTEAEHAAHALSVNGLDIHPFACPTVQGRHWHIGSQAVAEAAVAQADADGLTRQRTPVQVAPDLDQLVDRLLAEALDQLHQEDRDARGTDR